MQLVEDAEHSNGCERLLDDEELACRLALAMANCQFAEAGITTYPCMSLGIRQPPLTLIPQPLPSRGS